MTELAIAVVGGVIVLLVQAIGVALWQWRKRVRSGEIRASRLYNGGRKLILFGRRRQVRSRLTEAADSQRRDIDRQYEQDPLWRLGQLRLVCRGTAPQFTGRKSLEEAMARTPGGRGLLVKGEPGAGKSSTAALAAHRWSADPLALRYDLASFEKDDDLLTEVAQAYLDLSDVEKGLALDAIVLLFDGFESLDESSRKSFDRQLQAAVSRFPDLRFAVLSRPEAQPTKTLLKCVEADLQELSDDDVRDAMRHLGKDPATVLAAMDERILSICSSPLALRMVLQSMDEKGAVSEKLSTLYSRFVDALLRETSDVTDASAIPEEAKRQLLGVLATFCDNRTTSFSFATAQRVLSPSVVELQSLYKFPANVEAIEAIRQLVMDGILRSDGRTLKYVHYSVQEFLAADALRLALAKQETTIAEIVNLANDRHWHNSLVYLAGILDDATELVESLVSRNRVLSAECAQAAAYVDPQLVDMCIVEALYEFKFGKMSFNYEQVFSLLRIADLRSPDLPTRIISEMDYWCTKYADRAHTELHDIEDGALIGLLRSGGSGTREQDAAWTLGVRGSPDAVPVLEELVRSRTPPMDRVAALALGKLRSKRSASLLLSTALDTSANEGLRSTCFNAVGETKAKECLPAVLEFIRSGEGLDGTVRENAAWALIGLVDPLLAQDPEFQDLLIEQVDVGRPYARAMFVYLIGQFNIRKALPTLSALCLNGDTDPLVLEDVAFALGEMRDDCSLDAIDHLLHQTDNIVRARAIEAAGKLSSFPREELLRYASDKESSDIVQTAARHLLESDDPHPKKVAGVTLTPDLRRRR